MIQHIGNFTQYLASHQSEYDIDLEEGMMISGGSAGGQLASAVALAIDSRYYYEIILGLKISRTSST